MSDSYRRRVAVPGQQTTRVVTGLSSPVGKLYRCSVSTGELTSVTRKSGEKIVYRWRKLAINPSGPTVLTLEMAVGPGTPTEQEEYNGVTPWSITVPVADEIMSSPGLDIPEFADYFADLVRTGILRSIREWRSEHGIQSVRPRRATASRRPGAVPILEETEGQ